MLCQTENSINSMSLIGLKFQKILDFMISTGVLYGWGGGWSLPDLKYLVGNLKYLRKS